MNQVLTRKQIQVPNKSQNFNKKWNIINDKISFECNDDVQNKNPFISFGDNCNQNKKITFNINDSDKIKNFQTEENTKCQTKKKKNSIKNDKKLNEFENEEYEIEYICDKKIEGKKAYYLVKWYGWEMKDSTWEPLENLSNALNIVQNFEKNLLNSTNEKFNKNQIEIDNTNLKLKENRTNKDKNDCDYSKKKEKKKKNYFKKSVKNFSEVINNKEDFKSLIEEDKIINNVSTYVKIKPLSNISQNHNDEFQNQIPDKIVGAFRNSNNELFYIMKWKEHEDGIHFKNQSISSSVTKEKYPEELFNFLESKIKFK